MSRPVRPISEVARGRPQEAGKIKIGKLASTSSGRMRPASIDTFRFTTRDREQVDRLAAAYGGDVVTAPDGSFDLETTSNEINVILPPDPLGGTPIYELWSGGGCARRCDGEEVTVPIRTGDDVAFVDQPCICAMNDSMECKPTVRLSVIIPETSLTGVWNLRTNSWAATREMSQMASLIDMAQSRGLVSATLAVERREQMSAGRKRKFVVPVLRLKATLEELADGGGVATIGPAPTPAAALPAPRSLSPDDRARLNAAWASASDADRKDAMNLLGRHGITSAAGVTPDLVEDVIDALVVAEPS